jgi:hypothetical protein
MNIPIHIATLAAKKARQSICRNKVAAIGLNWNGDVVSKKFNRPRFSRKGGGVHAEMEVMHEAKRKGVVAIIICRISGENGSFLPIDPCPTCKEKAEELGIKIYSISVT